MVQVLAHAAGAKGGYVFVAEKKGGTTGGPLIVDSRGRVVWYHEIAPPQQATDFRVQRYHGKPVLTWWQGTESVAGTGEGSTRSTTRRTVTSRRCARATVSTATCTSSS